MDSRELRTKSDKGCVIRRMKYSQRRYDDDLTPVEKSVICVGDPKGVQFGKVTEVSARVVEHRHIAPYEQHL